MSTGFTVAGALHLLKLSLAAIFRPDHEMADPIFKIAPDGEWAAAMRAGVYAGSRADRKDGFLHFSTASQLAGTAGKHFAGQDDLVLAAIDPARLGGALKWEPARGGELFPHLYGLLAMTAVLWTRPLPLDSAGRHVFPPELAA